MNTIANLTSCSRGTQGFFKKHLENFERLYELKKSAKKNRNVNLFQTLTIFTLTLIMIILQSQKIRKSNSPSHAKSTY